LKFIVSRQVFYIKNPLILYPLFKEEEHCHGLDMKYPPQVHVLNTWSPLVVQFGKMETSGGGANLEEVDHWVLAFEDHT
jgi:hypothetical protein